MLNLAFSNTNKSSLEPNIQIWDTMILMVMSSTTSEFLSSGILKLVSRAGSGTFSSPVQIHCFSFAMIHYELI